MSDRRPDPRKPITGQVDSIEFVKGNDADGREPGTYVTIKLDGAFAITAGKVLIRQLD